ncbi:hypothetical protein G6O69_35370 [Pseudenhygromyxa sp. WMMC2535]|uniref:hypothetical protein n=1 Tax=Pseudenhygromyxa sp. WMMC2535 TaxID=2712867 RepID=UPI0015555884|nr:hypothetical protein [Pseudenhygromyxa sp. WMMC2535]NVB43158.1 hypothetical protein [Pseudenhygromyxa sp. WMMC2535]
MSTSEFRVDPVGVTLIVGFGLLITPGVVFVSVYLLSHHFDFAQASVGELIAAGLSALVGVVVVRATARELAGGVGVVIDEQGVRKGGKTIPWSEVESLEAPQFGLLDIVAGQATLRLRTYLYRDRRSLLRFIAERTGKTAPELGNSL